MRAIILAILLGTVACHQHLSPEQAADRIEALADQACTCTTDDCTNKAVSEIGELTDIVDVTKFNSTSARAMEGYSRAMSCLATKLKDDYDRSH